MKVQEYPNNILALKTSAVELLKELIATPSFSKEEDKTTILINDLLISRGIETFRFLNNVWCKNKYFDVSKPTILLNSHHDTVKPNTAYTKDPFKAEISEGKLYGLGSNDAGGPLVSLLATFLNFYDKQNLNYNVIFAATAEEEISGQNGVAAIIDKISPVDFAIVGEPTLMQMATAEKGLMVLDCKALGKAGHAAREEGDNAIYKALKDIEWFRTFKFPKISKSLGEIKMSVTVIKAGTQHNVVPSQCEFTIDVRTTDAYSNEAVLEIIKQHVSCEVTPRSVRLQPSSINEDHPFVVEGKKLGITTYGSPTTSDQALMPWPSLKMGPGDSARSHSADEFINVIEIEDGIETYINILKKLL